MNIYSVKYIPQLTGEYPELENYSHIYVSKYGMIVNRKTNKPLKKYIDKYGYEKVYIGKKQYLVHRLVALLFVQRYNPKHKIVCHKNKRRNDNRATNLMWSDNNFINIRRDNFEMPNRGRKVVAVKDGKFVGLYNNAGIASRDLKLNRSEIYRCCKSERKSTGGYTFSYHDETSRGNTKYLIDYVIESLINGGNK